jgi:hypothetical protein
MGMSYQVAEIVVPALAHVVGSGITVNCGIMYVPNGWWKQVGYVLRPVALLWSPVTDMRILILFIRNSLRSPFSNMRKKNYFVYRICFICLIDMI